ncbi:MAG: DNA internalization-related competence protein ComEC/Rec2 [candidate division NC10 bacterium]|nr:DNA internalization-related competence protein ComEC/Rec2 [candidate division NC10 bacterium]
MSAIDGELQTVSRFRRPLIPLVLAYGTGVLAGSLVQGNPLFLLAVLFPLLGMVVLAIWTKRQALATALLLVGFLLLGCLRYVQVVRPQGRFHLSTVSDTLLKEKVELEGIIVSPPETYPPGGGWRREGRVRFLMEAEAITLEGVRYPATGGARLSIIAPIQAYRYGHRIRGHFRLRRPRGYWNPGAFNYRRYAMTRGFYLEGWGRDGGGIEILDREGGGRIFRGISDLRETMLNRMGVAFSGEEGGMLRAIVLGDRSGLSPEVREAFLGSGTYHILVISGLHVGFLAGVLFFLGRCLRLPPSASSLLTVLGVVFYTLLTGGSPPVVRAAIMTSLYLLALIVGRERDLANTVALAGFLLLLWNPLYVYDAGFQLTFVATGAILIALGRFDFSHLPRPSRWVLASLVASTAATLGTVPLLALHFNRASLTGILANLVIVPAGGFLTAIGMGYGSFLLLFPGGISLLEAGISSVIRGMIDVASTFAAFPLASIRLYTPTPLMVLTSYGLFGLVVFSGVRRRRLWLGVTAVLLVGQIGWKLYPPERQGIEVTFLDVGQGDAIFLELPGRRTMLVDGGGSLGNVFDIGERVVAPYLWYRWIRGLDVVVLSHPQPDHLYGLRAVLENFPVGEVWESGYPSTSSTYRWLHSFVRRRGIPLRRITRGTDIPLGAEVMVKVLHPPQSFLIPGRGHASAIVNNNSLVLRIDYQAFRILLTGDIEKEAEASLLDAGVILQADLLKVPHHGSRGSSSVSFLRGVRPRWAVIQAGDRNPFGHPHPETLTRYAARGVQVLRTDRDGAVTFEFRDGVVTRRTFRKEFGL